MLLNSRADYKVFAPLFFIDNGTDCVVKQTIFVRVMNVTPASAKSFPFANLCLLPHNPILSKTVVSDNKRLYG